jgi:hypothetical protein
MVLSKKVLMKYCSHLILCLLLLPFLSIAQENYNRPSGFTRGNTRLGFTLTPNIGWMRVTNSAGANVTSDGSRAGFSYGVLGDFGFDKNYFFATAFTITSINGKLNEPVQTQNTSTQQSAVYKLQYIEVPLTLKLKTNPTDLARFYGQFGLGTGVKISGKEAINDGGNATAEAAKIFRASLIIGAGAEWAINPGLNLQTGLTLNHGLTNSLSGPYDIRSDYLALALSIFF